jgi:phosphorylcholine metabolism protein LicD
MNDFYYSKTSFKNRSYETIKEKVATIKKLEKILPDNDIILSFGTLLGCIRDKSVIMHDTDIDVSYISNYHTAKEVEKEMIDIHNKLLDMGILCNYFRRSHWRDTRIIEIEEDTKIDSPLGHCHIKIDGYVLDLFAAWEDEKGDLYLSTSGSYGKGHRPLITTEFYGMTFKIPKNYDEILTRLYGNWREPRQEDSKLKIIDDLTVWLGEE